MRTQMAGVVDAISGLSRADEVSIIYEWQPELFWWYII